MTLSELIGFLERCDPQTVVPIGLGHPHSYRGNYCDLAFACRRTVTVARMIESARSAIGQSYQGWKGGDYTMDAPDITAVHLVKEEGKTGEEIGPVLLAYMTGRLDLLCEADWPCVPEDWAE